MPWGRLDDSLYDHPKLDRLPALEEAVATIPGDGLVRLAALGLWTRAISWCNRFLTDGDVPRDRIAKLDGSRQLAELLVSAGLFEPTATGFRVHDFLAFNDSREQVLERRKNDAERKAKWRAERDAKKRPSGTKRGTPRSAKPVVTDGVTASVTAGLQSDSRARGRGIRESRPDPSESSTTTPQPPASGGRRRTRARDLGPIRSTTDYDSVVERDGEVPSWMQPDEKVATS